MKRKLSTLLFVAAAAVLTLAHPPEAKAWDQCELCLWRCDLDHVGCLNYDNPPSVCEDRFAACNDQCYTSVCF